MENRQRWMQEIFAQPQLFEGKFVVHNESEVLFASVNIWEAEEWLSRHRDNYTEQIFLFLVPSGFGEVRLRMLKIKNLSTGVWMPPAK